jgi:LysM repeat protein
VAATIALLGPIKISAQEATPSAHTVKRGDTLWDLAKLYLGDSFLWPEIYRLNTDVIEDPHWIYPGEILKLPAPGTMPPVAETPPVKQAGEPAASPTPATPSGAPVPSASGTPVYEPPMAVLDGPNVFPKAYVDAPVVKQRSYAPPPAPAVKLGTYLAAPFVDRSGGPRGAGTIIKIVNLSVRLSARDPKAPAQLHDDLLIAPPAGSAAPEGQRYITFDVGPKVEGLGQIIVPTGVVEVTRAPRDHESAVARVTRIFGEIKAEQHVMPYDSTSLHVLGHPVPASDSLEAEIKFVAGDPMLPTLQDFVMIDLSAHDGIRIGDEFMFFLPRHKSEGSGGFVDPEVQIGRGQVVRVTPYGSTLMIVGEKHPKIEEGTMARRVATMP